MPPVSVTTMPVCATPTPCGSQRLSLESVANIRCHHGRAYASVGGAVAPAVLPRLVVRRRGGVAPRAEGRCRWQRAGTAHDANKHARSAPIGSATPPAAVGGAGPPMPLVYRRGRCASPLAALYWNCQQSKQRDIGRLHRPCNVNGKYRTKISEISEVNITIWGTVVSGRNL